MIVSLCVMLLKHVWHLLVYRRFKTAQDIPESYFQKHFTIKGKVVRVGDSDGFRMVHTPYWCLKTPWVEKGKFMKETISIRLAGIDAPECGHFGLPAQPFGHEAKQWLESKLLHRTVHVQLFKRDQYQRVVGMVYVRSKWPPFQLENVSLQMLDKGYAMVYPSKASEFGGQKYHFEKAEALAKAWKRGLWSKSAVKPWEHRRKS